MKFITIGFMLWGGLLCGQTVIAPVVEGGANIPVPPCVTGQVYFNTGAAAGQNLYVCASNTWTQINSAAANGVSTNASNTYAAGTVQSFLGTLDASRAAATLPAQTGATLPATCSTGQFFLKTGADPSRMLYICSAANTWSQAAYAQGTTAQIPATCVAGQMYFATDAAAGNNLYFCTSSNTWTHMAGCASCVAGPGSSTDTYVPQWSGTSGNALGAGLPVSQSADPYTIAERDGGGNLTANFLLAGNAVNFYSRIYAGALDYATCTAGAVSLSPNYFGHRVNLNNQATCAITIGTGANLGMPGVILLCNGSTTATTTLTWTGLKGGMAAGGTTSQCAAQTVYYDITNSTWYATSSGSTWN